MNGIGRAFVAVVPPPEVLNALEERVATARGADDDIRWAKRAQLHVTLQFLGRVDDQRAVIDALESAVGGIAPFSAHLGAVGAFPSANRARIVWVGTSTGTEEHVELATAVHRALHPLGYEAEARAFHPHLTVGRVKRPHGVAAVLEVLGGDPIGPVWEVREVVLFESDTRPDGARHYERARLGLGGQDP